MAEASQQPPLAARVPAVDLGVEIPPEPPDITARQLYLAARMLAGATAFFYLAFIFAYFYLRSLNQQHMWRPKGVGPEQGFGVAIVVVLVISALLAYDARRLMAPRSCSSASSMRPRTSDRPPAPTRASTAVGPLSTRC